MADANSTLEQAIAKADVLIQADNVEAADEQVVIPPFYHQPLKSSLEGGNQSNTEARNLVKELRDWARASTEVGIIPGDHGIHGAFKDLEKLFVGVWTEIDEALLGLSMFKRVLESRAPDMLAPRPDDGCFIKQDGTRVTGLETAMMYLHRWQDRGGAIGNVAQGKRPGHPLTELYQVKRHLEYSIARYDDVYETMETVTNKIATLLYMARNEESRERELLLLECADELNDSLRSDAWKAKCDNEELFSAEEEKAAA